MLSVSMSVYWYYIRSGGWWNFLFMAISMVSIIAVKIVDSYWLNLWSADEQYEQHSDLYCMLSLSLSCFCFCFVFVFVFVPLFVGCSVPFSIIAITPPKIYLVNEKVWCACVCMYVCYVMLCYVMLCYVM